jgi:hypothetical protein
VEPDLPIASVAHGEDAPRALHASAEPGSLRDDSDSLEPDEPQLAFPPLVAPIAPPSLDAPAAEYRQYASDLVRQWRSVGLPESILGQPVTTEVQADPTRGPRYTRRRVACSNLAHGASCRKARSVVGASSNGFAEVFGYLAVWSEAGSAVLAASSRDAHMRFQPTAEAVGMWLRERGLVPS